MANREIKDEINAENAGEAASPAAPPRSPIQLPVSPQMEDTLVQIVKEDYDASKRARGKKDYGLTSKGEKLSFDEWLKGLRDLYNSRREPKDVPWKFCSNRSLRIATSILDLLHSRLMPAVINEDLVRWRPGEVNDVPKVDRITKLMRWWIWIRSKQRQFFDDWVKIVLGYGDSLTETTWSATPIDSGQTESTPIVDETGQPVINPDGQPAVMKSRIIDLFEKTESRFFMKDQVYLQEGSRDIQREPVIIEENYLFRELEEGEANGTFVNVTNLLREKIPYDKGSTVGLSAEEAEKIRSIKIRNQSVKILKWYSNFDSDGDGYAEDVRVYISPEYDIYLGGMAIRDITKSGKRPIEFTKLESRIDRPCENDGEGLLEKVKELAEAVDANFNQLEDSNTLSILRPGFYDPSGDLEADKLKLAPNKIQPVSDPSRNVYFPDITIQTDKLILAIRLILEFIERLTAASSYVLGKESEIVGGSGTATRTNQIVNSAEQRFALPGERLRAAAARIIGTHLDLLQRNIPPGLETRILGEKGEPLFGENELTADGIAGEFDAYILPDPAMGSKQSERELASMFYSILLQNVIVGTDPTKIYQVTADLLRAYGKEDEIVKYLGPQPAGDNVDDPEDENTLLIQGDFTRVRAQIAENHIYHIQQHMNILNSPTLAEIASKAPELVNQIIAYTQAHIAEHQQMLQTMMGLVTKFGGGKSGGNIEGNGNEGEKPGSSSESEGPGEQRGMENTSGPLAQAMASKREGQSGGAPNGKA